MRLGVPVESDWRDSACPWSDAELEVLPDSPAAPLSVSGSGVAVKRSPRP